MKKQPELTPEQQALWDKPGGAGSNDAGYRDNEGYLWLVVPWTGSDGVRHIEHRRFDEIMFFSKHFREPRTPLRHLDNDPANDDPDNLVEGEQN